MPLLSARARCLCDRAGRGEAGFSAEPAILSGRFRAILRGTRFILVLNTSGD